MSDSDRMNMLENRLHERQSRISAPDRSIDEDIDQMQEQTFGNWNHSEAHESSNSEPTPVILHGPRNEVMKIETPTFQTTTFFQIDAVGTSQDEQKLEAMTSWLAGLDRDTAPHKDAGQHQPATFGLEFEFLVPAERKGIIPTELSKDDRYFTPFKEYSAYGVPPTFPAQIYIAEVLNNAQMFCVSILDKYEEKDPLLHRRLNEDHYSVWRVKGDSSVRPDTTTSPHKDWRLLGLEINSPKLPASESGFLEVENALRLMREKVLLHLSTTSGLHVHVDMSPLTFAERKHFLSLYLMVEDVLFSFCAPHRLDNQWCRPTARHSQLANSAPATNYDRSPLQRRRREEEQPFLPSGQNVSSEVYEPQQQQQQHYVVQRMDSTRDMQRMVDPPRTNGTRTALALKNVGAQYQAGEEDQEQWTFEFRHFQATLDPELAKQWARICVALVLAARGLGEHGRKSLANMTYNRFHGIGIQEDKAEARRELLTVLGLEDAVDFWEHQVLTYQTPDGWLQNELGPDGFAPVLE